MTDTNECVPMRDDDGVAAGVTGAADLMGAADVTIIADVARASRPIRSVRITEVTTSLQSKQIKFVEHGEQIEHVEHVEHVEHIEHRDSLAQILSVDQRFDASHETFSQVDQTNQASQVNLQAQIGKSDQANQESQDGHPIEHSPQDEQCFNPSCCCDDSERMWIALMRAYLRPFHAPTSLWQRVSQALDSCCGDESGSGAQGRDGYDEYDGHCCDDCGQDCCGDCCEQ